MDIGDDETPEATPNPRGLTEGDAQRRPRRPPGRARRARLGGDQRRPGHRRRRGHPAGAGRPAPRAGPSSPASSTPLPRRWAGRPSPRATPPRRRRSSRRTAPTAPPRSSPASSPTPWTGSRRRCVALAPLVALGRAGRHPPRGAVAQRRALRRPRPDAAARARPRPRWRGCSTPGDGTVRMVTLAPELDGGLDVRGPARRPRRHRGAGPQRRDATTVAREAIDAGVTVGTHLFNAMRAVHHREPGPVLALVEDPRVVRRADRRRRPPAPGGAALGRDVGAAPLRSWSPTRWAQPGRGRRRLRARPGRRAGARRGRAAGVERRHRRQHPHDGPRRPLCRDSRRAARSTPWSRRRRPRPPACSGSTTSVRIEPGRRADLVHLDEALEVVRVMRAGAWLS